MNSNLKLYQDFVNGNKMFFKTIFPKLPEHVQKELMQSENKYFSISLEGKENNYILNLSKSRHDITDVLVEIIN